MSGIWLPATALTINLFLVIVFFSKEKINNKEVTAYKYLLITGLLFSINALAVYIVAKTCGNELAVGTMQKIHLSLLNLFAYYFLMYNIIISSFTDKAKKRMLNLNCILTILLIIGVSFSPIKVINYDEILDVGGISYYISISGIIIYFMFLVLLNTKYMIENKHQNKKYLPFIILLFLFITGLVLRMKFPEIITETYCTAFVLLTMYFTIENPDIKLLNKIELAKDQAEKANAAKTDFLSSMSHEIRTPLNAIVGFSEAIKESDNLDEAKENAKDIVDASNNLLEIVNGILDISKIEANKMEIINTEYDLKEELEILVKLVKPRIGDKPVELNVNIAPDIPPVLYGDKGKIKEITSNILTNAVKYTKEGQIDLVVTCINKGSESSLMISVEDTGRGIKPEKIDKLFSKFERLEEDRNTTIEGAGLGLAITKSLVEMMGGKIIVQSVYGSGSKFTVYLKQRIVHNKQLVKKEENSNTKLILSDKKVLVVDDNLLNIKVAEKLLSKYSLNIETCESGLECIDKIKEGKSYDLIFMDDMMPKTSGTETLHILKEIPSFKDKVVALTANAIEGMEEKYLSEGFDDYLAKPIEKVELERILRKYLKKEFERPSFEPLPDEMYEIADSIVARLNNHEDKENDQ